MAFLARVRGWLAAGLLLLGTARGADFADLFAERQVLTELPAVVTGSNRNATVEAGEPRHGGKRGGHSVWLAWVAPRHGLLTVSTEGSSFDTLLSVFIMESGDDPPLRRLRSAGDSDDEGTDAMAQLAVGVRQGERYEIAVDGFAEAVGDIRLTVGFVPAGGLLPMVVRRPGDQALRPGDTLILTVDMAGVEGVEFRWYRNREKVEHGEAPTLVVENLDPGDTGFYELEVRLEDTSFFSAPVEIQLNSEGATSVLARNKLEDAEDSGLVRLGGRKVGLADAGGGVTRGYNGAQVFNTAYATRDPAEPQHCGVVGGPSYWFGYQPPADGTLGLDTLGSDYDTVLAVYTYDPPLIGFESLVPVACDNNSGGAGGAARLTCVVQAARTYYIVVDGAGGARGIAHLNYALTVAAPPTPAPAIAQAPRSQVVAAGGTIALAVVATGQPPLGYQWLRDGVDMVGQTNGSLTLANLQPADAGLYRAVVNNAAGTATSDPAAIEVRTSPWVALGSGSRHAVMGFPAPRGYRYEVQTARDAPAGPWAPVASGLADSGSVVWFETDLAATGCGFYRLIKQ
jgi:hypothetical protein